MFEHFKSPFFNFEFLRLLAMVPFEGGEIAEILEAIGKIKDLDPESWYAAWMEAGTKAEEIAQEGESTGDRIAARRGYLRASNYIRAAQFMLNEGPIGYDKRVVPTLKRAINDFRKGVMYLDGDVHFIEIPYENGNKLPGYLFLPPPDKRLPGKTPILINNGGGDSTQEEIYFINASVGPSLGYAVLLFEGPGQGIVLRERQLPMRPDYEVVTRHVLDYLFDFARNHTEYDLDLDRIAITGASMGGYYCLRAAADPRISACISVDGFYSMKSFISGRMPKLLWDYFERGSIPDSVFNTIIRTLGALNFQARWEFNHIKWIMGKESEAECLRDSFNYTLQRDDGSNYLDSVRCPVLVTGAGSSFYFDPSTSTTKIFNSLTQVRVEDKEEWIAKDSVFGGLQAKIGAFGYSMQRTFSWLDQKYNVDRRLLGVNAAPEQNGHANKDYAYGSLYLLGNK